MSASLTQAISDMRTMRESYDALAGAAEAYNEGKDALATAITAKGQTTSASDSLATMAGKISLIQQESYTINGGEMYAKQQFGSLTTPNYWNLYEVMASLLSDGRFVNYGGILLAEYYKGYATLSLSGAGAGGGYVTSDGQYYTEDVVHTWNDDTDGKGNRWVAYLFASEGHGFTISDTNTCPRSIHIGRHVGTIESLVNGRISEIVVTDGNTLDCFKNDNYTQPLNKHFVLRNLGEQTQKMLHRPQVDSIYIKADKITGNLMDEVYDVPAVVLVADEISGDTTMGLIGYGAELKNIAIVANKISGVIIHANGRGGVETASLITEELTGQTFIVCANLRFLYIGYITNDKSKSVQVISFPGVLPLLADVELQAGYCKNVSIAYLTDALTEANMYAHILQRLKQDEEDCGDGVTITLGATNLAKLTSEASVALLDSLTNTYGYTFA